MLVATTAHAAPPRDYAVGVAKLSQLGLPDVRQAKYVQLDAGYAAAGELSMFGDELKMSGNAWLLATKPDGTAVMLLDQVRLIEVVPLALAEQRMKERLEAKSRAGQAPGTAPQEPDEPEDSPYVVPGKWRDADLAADLGSVIGYLEKPNGGNDYAVRRSAGLLFLFAAQVHSRGLGAEANRLMALLFEISGDSRMVVSEAINRIADAQYQEAYRSFAVSGNWAQYLAAMEAQAVRFGSVWRQAPVVARVAEAVRSRLAPPALAGEGLTDEDRRIAGLLGQSDAVVSLRHPLFSSGTWVLQVPGLTPGSAKSGPLDLIQQRGTAAIPLLVALLSDARLVRTTGGVSAPFLRFNFDEGAMSEEEIERMWPRFPRPQSIGELAQRILSPLVLSEEEARGEEGAVSNEVLAQKGREWYSQHKGEDRAALRRLFLAAGRQEVVWQMIRSPEAADREAVEAYLLAGKDPQERLSHVVDYARVRGVEAKAFVQRYVAGLQKTLPSGPGAGATSPEERQSIERKMGEVIKFLEELVSERTGTQQLQEFLAVEQPWSERKLQMIAQSLVTKLAKEDPTAVRTALLQGCVKTKDDVLAGFLLSCVGFDRAARMRAESQEGAGATPAEEPKLEAHAELWRQVMARPRHAASKSIFDSSSLGFDVVGAYVVEGLYGEGNPENTNPELAQILGERLYSLTVQRAQARLAGKPAAELPRVPDKVNVGAERRTEITLLLQGATAQNQHELSARLSLDELLVIPELVAADPKLNQKLVAGSHVIREVRLPEGNADLARVCLPLKDKVLDRAAFEALLAECRRQAPLGVDVSVIFERRVPLAGVVLKVGTVAGPKPTAAAPDKAAPAAPALLIAAAQSEGDEPVRGVAQWPLGSAAALAPPPAKATAADDDLLPTKGGSSQFDPSVSRDEDFWKGFLELFAPTRSACAPYQCLLMLHRPEPKEMDSAEQSVLTEE
jgi:hypothetical protein